MPPVGLSCGPVVCLRHNSTHAPSTTTTYKMQERRGRRPRALLGTARTIVWNGARHAPITLIFNCNLSQYTYQLYSPLLILLFNDTNICIPYMWSFYAVIRRNRYVSRRGFFCDRRSHGRRADDGGRLSFKANRTSSLRAKGVQSSLHPRVTYPGKNHHHKQQSSRHHSAVWQSAITTLSSISTFTQRRVSNEKALFCSLGLVL